MRNGPGASVRRRRGAVVHGEEADRAPRRGVDAEMEDIRPGVVADGIELAPRGEDGPRVGLGVQDLLGVGHRPGDELAIRPGDGRVAAAHPVPSAGVQIALQFLRDVPAVEHGRHAQHVDAALLGDVPQRRHQTSLLSQVGAR